jgi:hypothetical protein
MTNVVWRRGIEIRLPMRALPNHLQKVRAPRLKGLGGASGTRQEADLNDGLISLGQEKPQPRQPRC